jgi:hypothetical protein
LGALFDTAGAADLSLRYRTPSGTVIEVPATYVANPAADFNENGVVGSADLAIWQSSYANGFAADADQDGDTDGADFLRWQQQVGAASSGSFGVLPEPSGAVLLIGCMTAWGSLKRQGRSLAIDQQP